MRQNWDAKLPALGKSARQFVRDNADRQTDRMIAVALTTAGFTARPEQVQQRRIQLGISKDPATRTVVRESPLPRYDSPPLVEGDAVVLGDVEFPFHHAEFLNRVIDLCIRWKIPQVVFAGDMLHHGQLSNWEPAWTPEAAGGMSDELYGALSDIAAKLGSEGSELRGLLERQWARAEKLEGISDEWAMARTALRGMRQEFKSATLILGNHEGRMLRALDSPTSPDDLRRILIGEDEWLKVAPYYHGLIQSGRQTWRVTHPRNTSTTPASIAAKLADKFGQNVLQAHNHLIGMQQSVSGKYWGVELGCVVDGSRLAYYAQRDTTRPAWHLGAAIIRDGYCWLLSPTWTDWKRLATMK